MYQERRKQGLTMMYTTWLKQAKLGNITNAPNKAKIKARKLARAKAKKANAKLFRREASGFGSRNSVWII